MILSKVFGKLLSSAAFRSGNRLIPDDDIRTADLPKVNGTDVTLSVLYGQQICSNISSERIGETLGYIQEANSIDLSEFDNRLPEGDEAKGSVNIWPGQHYRLLAAVVKKLQPKNIIEVGTYTGLSYLSLTKYMPADGKITTFDVVPVHEFKCNAVQTDEINSNNRSQIVGDLSDPDFFSKHISLFEACDLFFIDGPKDGKFEYAFWKLLSNVNLKESSLIILDDIRIPNMIKFWNEIENSRIDVTSFGHFTGTGILWPK